MTESETNVSQDRRKLIKAAVAGAGPQRCLAEWASIR